MALKPKYIFRIEPTSQIACINLRKNKILVGSFKQVAGVTDLDLNPSKAALPTLITPWVAPPIRGIIRIG
jgi:hypothetical protein